MLEQLIQIIAKNIPIRASEGWSYDLEKLFCGNENFQNANLKKCEDSVFLFQMEAMLSPNVRSIEQFKGIQRKLWNQIAWFHFDLLEHCCYQDVAELEFLTVALDDKSCVTGQIIISGELYREIASNAPSTSNLVKRWARPLCANNV